MSKARNVVVYPCVTLLLVATISADDSTIVRKKTPKGVEYGIWGELPTRPAPVLIMLAGTIDSTLTKPYFRQCGNQLAEHGWLTVSIDIPSHGTQSSEGDSGLGGWSRRAQRKQSVVAESNSRLSAIVDDLIETGIADPKKIALGGTSRGGFLALHFAAHDSRVQCVAAFAPVTDLTALSEFRALVDDPFTSTLSVAQQADRLADRPVWIVIGDQDERVSTDRAVELARKITAAARVKKLNSQVELRVMPEPRGHTTPRGSDLQAAQWILEQFNEGQTSQNKIDVLKKQQTSQHILFVDDHDVLYRAGTKRVFHQASLHPKNPLLREDKPWEMAIGWTSVVRHADTGKYQLWYQAYGGRRDERKTHKCVVCYAESSDGLTFVKPQLPLHDFKTDREPFTGHYPKTNIVLLGSGGYGDRYANSVLLEPHEVDSGKRYKMLYTDFSKDKMGQEWPGFHAAFSPDGIRWSKSPNNPLNQTAYGGRGTQPPLMTEDVYSQRWDERKQFMRKTWRIPLTMSDAADVMFDPVRKVYVAYGKCWIQGPSGGLAWKHAMARAESHDFLHWSKPHIVCSPDDQDPPNIEFHTSPVFHHKDVYFCLNQILRARGETVGAKADLMHVELMISRDGIRWERPFRGQPFFPSDQQAFSNGGIFTNSTPVFLEDQIRFYYGGYNSGAIGGGAKLTDASQQSGVGLATLPLDRFAGIRPVSVSAQSTLKRPLENIGQITLKPRDLAGVREILINGDASDGAIRLEVLNEDGFRVPGFTKDEAVVISTDELRAEAKWKAHKLSQLPAGNYMLRLHLDNAEVFAMTLNR